MCKITDKRHHLSTLYILNPPLHPSISLLTSSKHSNTLFLSLFSLLQQMSIIFTASPPKDCSKKGHNQFFHHLKSNRKLLLSLSGLIFSLLSISFLIWLIFHPTDPKFYLKDLSARNSTISTTFISKNPNSHASIYYDKLHVYLAYAGVQITPDVALPPFNQGQLDNDILSANLVGPTGTQSAASSTVMKLPSLNLKIEGNLRWKVGPWLSGWYKLEVDCMAVLMGRPGLPVPVSSVQGAQCSTNSQKRYQISVCCF